MNISPSPANKKLLYVLVSCALILWLGGVLIVPPAVAAQQSDAEKAPEIGRFDESLPAPADLDALIKQYQDARDQKTTDDQKKPFDELINAYLRAKEQLLEIQKYNDQTVEFRQAREQAPEKLTQVKTELENTPREPKVDEPYQDWSLTQIEQRLKQLEAEFAGAGREAADREAEALRRTQRRTEVPQALAQAREQLDNIKKEFTQKPDSSISAEQAQANRVLARFTQQALEKRIESLNEEILSYDARSELLASRRELATRRVAYYESLVKQWQKIFYQQRQIEAQQTADQVQQARRQAALSHPLIQKLAEENVQLAQLRTGPKGLIALNAARSATLEEIEKELSDVTSEFDSVQKKLQAAGLTDVISVILLSKRNELPDTRLHKQNIKNRRAETARARFEWLKYDEQYAHLTDVEVSLEETFEEITDTLTPEQRELMEPEVRTLLQTRRDLIKDLVDEYDTYLGNLADLDVEERLLVRKVNEFTDYINENILWVRIAAPLSLSVFADLWDALLWLAAPDNWYNLAQAVMLDLKSNPALYALLVLALLILSFYKRRFKRRISEISSLVGIKYKDSLLYSLHVLFLSVLMVLSIPLLLMFLGQRLLFSPMEYEFLDAVGWSIRQVGLFILVVGFLRIICLSSGLAVKHFGLPVATGKFIRRHLYTFMVCMIPLMFIGGIIEHQSLDIHKQSLGRVVLILQLMLLSGLLAALVRPRGLFMQAVLLHHPEGWLARLKFIWYSLAVVLPLAIALSAALGYNYSARQLFGCLVATLFLILILILLSALIIRSVSIVQTRLAWKEELEQLRQKRDKSVAPQQDSDGDTEKTSSPQDEAQEELRQISVKSKRFLRTILVLILLVGLWFIWSPMLPALGIFDRMEIWQTTKDGIDVPVTVADLIFSVIVIIATIIMARNLIIFLDIFVLVRLPLDRGVRFAIVTITRYLIAVVGVVLALSLLGVSWSKVQWLIAAMTVGLGFGLQEIFANFVSGLIILFEQPMRVGDTVTVGDISGEVTRIRIRATTIRAWDRKELLVPNKEFVTGRLVNWSLSDNILRMTFPVGIAYGSDIDLAEKLLKQIAKDHKKVLDEPRPKVIFKGFGDSSLEFELRAFISHIDDYLVVWHDINCAIDKTFRASGVEIAFPQRDLHLRSIKTPIPVTVKKPDNQTSDI